MFQTMRIHIKSHEPICVCVNKMKTTAHRFFANKIYLKINV